MKKRIKQLLSFILVLVLFVSIFPTAVMGIESETDDGLIYVVVHNGTRGNYVRINGIRDGSELSKKSDIIIPEEIAYYPVESLFEYCFFDMKNIVSITLPDSIKWMSRGAFYGCTSLETVNFPKSCTYIEYELFKNCSSLKTIDLPDIPGGVNIYDEAFSGCSSLDSINIPEGTTYIGTEAFKGCSSLESIKIPESVTSIRKETFSGCSSVKSINIPESVISIGDKAFSGCSSLNQ